MKALPCLLFLSVIWGAESKSADSMTMVGYMRHQFLKLAKSLKDDLAKYDTILRYSKQPTAKLPDAVGTAVTVPTVTNEKEYLHLIRKFKVFGDELEDLCGTGDFENLNELNNISVWSLTQNQLRHITWIYKKFRKIQRDIIDLGEPLDLDKLVHMAATILKNPNLSVIRALEYLSGYIVRDKLFIAAYQETVTDLCYEQQSPQQLLYNLYTTITLAQIKGYSMIEFSYMLLRLYRSDTNFTNEVDLAQKQYLSRVSETLRAVKKAMAFAPRDLWKCDPYVAKLDDSYTELTQLFQGYVVNEVDLNIAGTCRGSCEYYSYGQVHGCYQNQFCSKQRKCNGKLLNCEYVDSDMWICPASTKSNRRYEYIEYENGVTFGRKNSCNRSVSKVDSWWRWIFWHCSYCFCYCDDNTAQSDRYFSLRSVMADIKNNRVITGIAFTKVNQIIHMKIQDGELLPRGSIDKTSLRWRNVDTFSTLDHNITDGVDYHTLSWEKKGIDLDDLVAPKGHLLTGVRFRTLGTRLNLEIMVTPFEFTTGQLVRPTMSSYWLSNDNTTRTELKLPNPDIPTRNAIPTAPDSKRNQYVNFAASDRNGDAAQSTIPFIDVQALQPNPPVPISGAGIFHKGKKNSGGYIALKLITYDFTQHIAIDVPAGYKPISYRNANAAVETAKNNTN